MTHRIVGAASQHGHMDGLNADGPPLRSAVEACFPCKDLPRRQGNGSKLRCIRREWRIWLFSNTNQAMELQECVAFMPDLADSDHDCVTIVTFSCREINHRHVRTWCSPNRGCFEVGLRERTSIRQLRNGVHGDSSIRSSQRDMSLAMASIVSC